VSEDVDQDAMAAEWEAMAGAGGDGGDGDAFAAEWEAMVDENQPDFNDASKPEVGGTERILNQDEIDNLLGFDPNGEEGGARSGIRALINSALISYERLPMLEIIFDRLVRLLTTSLRNFTSDNVEVSLDNISSIRFGDYLNSVPLPAILAVFRAKQLDNFGLMTVDSNLIYSIVDVLLGGRRGTQAMRVEGRPYTTIERVLVQQMIEVIMHDLSLAFAPLTEVNFELDRVETNPRFAAIARSANAALIVKMRIDMEDRGGRVELLLPYATLEPIRKMLLQQFMGEKFGRDNIWENHLATELWDSEVEVMAVLEERSVPLRQLRNWKVGDTVMLDATPATSVVLKCGDIALAKGSMGKLGHRIAVCCQEGLDRSAKRSLSRMKS
jgi:flagellar motor switch protein FliM